MPETNSVAKMKSLLLTAGSFLLTTGVVMNAYLQKKQFYPSVVYITKSSPSMAVLYIQAFVFVILFGKMMRKIFFGSLRAAEMEHLIERSWYAVTETCLAFTVFRDDFSPRFVALFTLLLFLKCFHWLAEDRIDFMERSPVITVLFHLRAIALLSVLASLDAYFVQHAYYSTLLKGATVQLVFGFEYAILMMAVIHAFVKYVLHTIDLQNENPWETKTAYLLYTELVLGFVKVVLYMLFLFIMIKVHTFPLFAIRPMYLTMRAFKKAMNDVILSRRAIRNMNTLYPDATPEELSSGDNVCIICREEMTSGCKKLPCNHIFHMTCLRSWFQRQQTCPTCRMDILRPQPATPRPQQNGQAPQQQQAPAQPGAGMPPQGFPGFPFRPWPPIDAVPPAPAAAAPAGGSQSSAATSATSTTTPSTSQIPPFNPTNLQNAMPGGSAAMPPFMMPPFFMPMPFSVPPPVPGSEFTGLSDEELRNMEGHERQNLEARIQCLRNIHTLLDAAMVQVQQYTAVVQSMGMQGAGMGQPARGASSPTPAPSHAAATHTTDSIKSPRSSTTSAETSPPSSSSPVLPMSTAASSSQPATPENPDLSGLEGAVGYTPPKEVARHAQEFSSEDSEEMNEVRRRRLQKFSSNNLQALDDSSSKDKDKELDLD